MTMHQAVDRYENALMRGEPQSVESERPLYLLHRDELDRLRTLLSQSASQEDIAAWIAHERRTFGWSYLPGSHGVEVGAAFAALATALESSEPNPALQRTALPPLN